MRRNNNMTMDRQVSKFTVQPFGQRFRNSCLLLCPDQSAGTVFWPLGPRHTTLPPSNEKIGHIETASRRASGRRPPLLVGQRHAGGPRKIRHAVTLRKHTIGGQVLHGLQQPRVLKDRHISMEPRSATIPIEPLGSL